MRMVWLIIGNILTNAEKHAILILSINFLKIKENEMKLTTKVNRKLRSTLMRNRYSMNGKESKSNQINLEYWSDEVNVGDILSNCVYRWMLEQKQCDPDHHTDKTIHFLAIGSIIGMKPFDAVIWGSGIHTIESINSIYRNRKMVNYDIRAVRGPITKKVLESSGYPCQKAVCGDPAILMPKIYTPACTEKKYPCSVIMHLNTPDKGNYGRSYHCISVNTKNHQQFIDEIVASERIISSSLHGIILAETYGIPAVFLNENGLMNKEIMKYFDWYWSTGRDNVVIAHSIGEAKKIKQMPLPELHAMQDRLMQAFPYDLWK